MPKTLLAFTHLAEGRTSGGECEYEMKDAVTKIKSDFKE